jgi:hypothetical protein
VRVFYYIVMRIYSYITNKLRLEIYRLESGFGEICEDNSFGGTRQKVLLKDCESVSSLLGKGDVRLSVRIPEQYITGDSYYSGLYSCIGVLHLVDDKFYLLCDRLEYGLDEERLIILEDRMRSGWDRESLWNICLVYELSRHSLMTYGDLELLDYMGVDYE